MQHSRLSMIPVWAAYGWRKQEHPLRVAEWLLVEWPKDSTKPTKYWLAQLGSQPSGLRRLGRIPQPLREFPHFISASGAESKKNRSD